MDRALRRRLLGAMVLISLGVIFLPMMFSGQGGIRDPSKGSIPARPDWPELRALPLPVDLYSTAVAQQAQASAELAKNTLAQVQSKTQPAASTKNITSKGEQGTLSSWVTQLGSFGKEKNALALRDQLRAHKYPAFIEPVKLNNKVLYRVRVGPELDHNRARKIRDEVSHKFKLKGQLLRYP